MTFAKARYGMYKGRGFMILDEATSIWDEALDWIAAGRGSKADTSRVYLDYLWYTNRLPLDPYTLAQLSYEGSYEMSKRIDRQPSLATICRSGVSALALDAAGALHVQPSGRKAHYIKPDGQRVVIDLETRHDVQSDTTG